MPSERYYNDEEIREIYRAMIGRLRTCAKNMPDEAVGKLNSAHLDIFLDHCEKIADPDQLEELFLVSLSRMKCSINGARFSLRGLLIDLALEGTRTRRFRRSEMGDLCYPIWVN